MVSLDQVKLLENKVAKTIEYVGQVIGENSALRQKEAELQAKLEAHQNRIDELEALIARFKEDQGRIEGGILSALERLNRFEDAIEKSLNEKPPVKTGSTQSSPALQSSPASQSSAVSQPVPAPQPVSASPTQAAAPVKAPVKKTPKPPSSSASQLSPGPQQSAALRPLSAPLPSSPASQPVASGSAKKSETVEEGVFFEIAETEPPEVDTVDSPENEPLNGEDAESSSDRELDIF